VHREVVDAIALRAALLIDLLQARRDAVLARLVGELGRDVVGALGEPVPDVVAKLVPSVIVDGFAHRGAELVVGHVRARRPDDGEAVGQQPPVGERVERREQLARGQVAGRTEDREDAGLGRALEAQALEQRVGLGDCGGRHQRGSELAALASSTA
jgi:hypothetical protein